MFLDGDYVKRNEKYLLGFDSLATITYNRGVITLIGDEMWRVQQVASKTSAKIGEVRIEHILNMDAQEETSRIIIVVEDSKDNIRKAISAIHSEEISEINFVKLKKWRYGFSPVKCHHGFVLGPLSRFSPALPKTRDTIG